LSRNPNTRYINSQIVVGLHTTAHFYLVPERFVTFLFGSQR